MYTCIIMSPKKFGPPNIKHLPTPLIIDEIPSCHACPGKGMHLYSSGLVLGGGGDLVHSSCITLQGYQPVINPQRTHRGLWYSVGLSFCLSVTSGGSSGGFFGSREPPLLIFTTHLQLSSAHLQLSSAVCTSTAARLVATCFALVHFDVVSSSVHACTNQLFFCISHTHCLGMLRS